jgi:hypothetical protein
MVPCNQWPSRPNRLSLKDKTMITIPTRVVLTSRSFETAQGFLVLLSPFSCLDPLRPVDREARRRAVSDRAGILR